MIKPPGDARQDLWIIQEIAQAHGAADWNYNGPADVFTEMAQVMPSLKNITWERLVREGAVTYPVDDPNKPGNEIIFTTGFPTAERPRQDRAGACDRRRTKCPTTNIRWCCRPAACSSTGTPAR